MALESFMKLIVQLVNCDTWRIFLLSAWKQENIIPHMVQMYSWEDACGKHARVVTNTFLSGISYYDADEQRLNASLEASKSTELIIPVFQCVCCTPASEQTCRKRS
jgi:hypothetical protein